MHHFNTHNVLRTPVLGGRINEYRYAARRGAITFRATQVTDAIGRVLFYSPTRHGSYADIRTLVG
ncbi:hypothetical protein ACFZCY_38960 [Streptomyces sp. NPDC007983]|uniref:hypothetical protein n=1 Tax=Streptomyces sp. NPDC007983 TaxID=3364800 RepID=UPI0036E55A4C